MVDMMSIPEAVRWLMHTDFRNQKKVEKLEENNRRLLQELRVERERLLKTQRFVSED